MIRALFLLALALPGCGWMQRHTVRDTFKARDAYRGRGCVEECDRGASVTTCRCSEVPR